VTAPVLRLMDGTDIIAAGDLNHRIAATGTDELAELARRFNRMVAELQATTVSKESLQVSEVKLRQTVDELRREIEEREHAQRERARLETALRRSEVMSTMGSLVAGVAHEVRNPLFGISSTVDALEARLDRHGVTEYAEHLGVLRGELTRLTRLMQDLLEYGKPPVLDLTWVAVDSVVSQAMEGCRTIAEQRGVRLASRVDPLLPRLKGDRRRLNQVFHNLIDNALHYSPAGTEVCIEARRADHGGTAGIECAVLDAGAGFEERDLRHVFEPFVTRRRNGTGLGLSIVHRIAEAHGGGVAASNRTGGGAIVTVWLPLEAEHVATAEGPTRAENDPRR
jgi:signal transduction histidine kinase